MPGTFFGLETARRGMQVHQNALNITGHNLANASTPGYSRQEAVITASDPYTVPSINSSVTPGQLGTGAQVDSIRRVRDEYLDNNVRRAITDTAYWEDQVELMQRAEATFAEPASDGIGQRIVDFFKAWMELNNTPHDLGIKSSVVSIGEELATMITSAYQQLDGIEESIADTADVTGKLYDQVNQVNDILLQIQQVTDAIKDVYSVNQQPNDLLDKRDMLLEELSKYGPVAVTHEQINGKPTGGIKVDFFGFTVFQDDTAVSPPTRETVALRVNSGSGNIELQIVGTTNTKDLTAAAKSGEKDGSLIGLEKARQNLNEYQDMLYALASTFKKKLHDALGSDFFFVDDDTSQETFMETFKVDPKLTAAPAALDGRFAGDVLQLRTKDVINGATFEEHYSLLITKVGNNAQSADGMAANQAAIYEQITALRDSVSGVAVDEELTKMIQFQYGFQASARMVNTIDGMLDVIINRLF